MGPVGTNMTSDILVFYVNGQKVAEENPNPEQNLLVYLRENLFLKGTKTACGQGACGACTVMLSKYDRAKGKTRHYTVTACLVPVCAVHGMAVTTVEGIGSVNTKLHPVQEMLVQAHGTQCGFCTPGFVMSMYTLLRNNPKPTMDDVNKALRGNLCRCTGYRPILDGFKPFTKDFCPMGDQCCQRSSSDGVKSDAVQEDRSTLYDPTQDPIFPSELQLSPILDQQSLAFKSGSVSWIRPMSLVQLLYAKSQYPGSMIVAGNTTIGLQRSFRDIHYPMLICVSHISELQCVHVTNTGFQFGAAVTLSTVEDYITEVLTNDEHNTDPKWKCLKVFGDMLRTFAALQTKNMVTMGGAVASSWPNSDVLPLLCALKAKLHVGAYGQTERVIELDQTFFKAAGRTNLEDRDVIMSVELPFLRVDQYAYSIKHSRRDFDTPIISTAAHVTVTENRTVIQHINVYIGNVSTPVLFAEKLSRGMSGRDTDLRLPATAISSLQDEFTSLESEGNAVSADLRSLMEASVRQLGMEILRDTKGEQAVPCDLRSTLAALNVGLPEGTRVFEEVPPAQVESDAVGRPVVHTAARQQATGEAQYIDDMPVAEDELYLELVTSSVGHARILRVDGTEALKVSGVVDFLTAKDVMGTNKFGPMIPDETIFAAEEVTYVGHVIAAIVATSKIQAERAVKLVQVEYEKRACITTIQEAIEKKSFFENVTRYNTGDVESGFKVSDVIVEGQVELGGQEHFYMETQRVRVVPLKEDQDITIYGPYQNAAYVQEKVAKALGIPYHNVTVLCKRAGGAFGGKETKMMLTLPAAVAAFKHKRAVRCVLSRDADMQMTGGRNPVLAKYKVGLSDHGVIQSLDVGYFVNGGHTTDSSIAVTQAIISNFDNCYRVPNAALRGFVCKTNIPSNTAMRGFGQPQAVLVTETWITHAAEVLGISPKLIRERNMYKAGDLLPLNGSAETLTIQRCWAETVERSQYVQRLTEIEKFNSENMYRKKGLAVGPIKFGLYYPPAFLNQGQALVNVYLDGSVLVHHGGAECGQGIHTKILQIASRALGLPMSHFHISDTNTDIINNATGTGGSSTTEVFGSAVLDACQKLLLRLEPYKSANPEGTWVDWVNAAYMDRVCLSMSGFYKVPTPDLGYDWETGKGVAFTYYSCGAACTEVEVDVMTGQHVVLRTDIVMDVGRSINPAIDIGQIEGAFMQGYGLYALEELRFDSDGRLTTKNALGYKVPVIANVPKQFNISLLKDAPNPKALYSAKGIGEPPLLLATTVAMAIREAIKAYRQQQLLNGHIQLNCPVTAEKVRAHCPIN